MESLLYPCASIKQVLQSLDLSRSERSVQPLFAPSRTQSKTFGAHLNLKTRLNCFSAVFAYRIVLICRATPASHAPRIALTRELQMWRACLPLRQHQTSSASLQKFCIFQRSTADLSSLIFQRSIADLSSLCSGRAMLRPSFLGLQLLSPHSHIPALTVFYLRSRQSTTSHNIIRSLRSSQFV